MSADRPAHPDDVIQVRHLRRTLDAVAARSAASADWEEVRARVQAEGVAPASIGVRRTRLRWLAVAAAVVLVAAIVAAAGHRRGDGHDQVQTGQFPAGSPGGFYIPEGLPKGWKPIRVTADEDVRTCLCRTATWREVGGDGWVQFRTQAFEEGATVEQPDPGELTIDLGDGLRGDLIERTGIEADQVGDWDLGWSDQHHYGAVSGAGISSDQATAIARALVADPLRLDIPIEGGDYDLVSNSVTEQDRVRASVQIEVRRPDGGTVVYSLGAPDAFVDESPMADWNRVDLPGQDLPVETWIEQAYTGPTHGYRPWTNYRGEWEGATMRAPGPANVVEGEFSPNAEQTGIVVASLRPATLEEWRAFVRSTKDHSDRVLEIESVSDLIPGRQPPGATTTEVATGPTSSTSPRGATTTG